MSGMSDSQTSGLSSTRHSMQSRLLLGGPPAGQSSRSLERSLHHRAQLTLHRRTQCLLRLDCLMVFMAPSLSRNSHLLSLPLHIRVPFWTCTRHRENVAGTRPCIPPKVSRHTRGHLVESHMHLGARHPRPLRQAQSKAASLRSAACRCRHLSSRMGMPSNR